VDDPAIRLDLNLLADLATTKNTDLDHGPRRKGLTIQLNHGYISYLFEDNHGRMAILTDRANPSYHTWSPHAYFLPTGHTTCRFTDVTDDTHTEDELNEATPAGLITLA
jgi:hypothetical protein